MQSWLELLKRDPTAWLLERASPPIRYRLLTEVLGVPKEDPRVARAREETMNFVPAVEISRKQQEAGTWLDKILDFEAPNPSRNRGPGMVNQFLALVEYGWDSEHPIIHSSAERLLGYARGDSRADIFELKGYTGSNKQADAAVRHTLAVISAALLARAGYGEEEPVRMVARRVHEELEQQYPKDRTPDLFDGTVEIGEDSKDHGTYRRVKDGHHVPDMFLFYLLAFHSHFQAAGPAYDAVQRVTQHLMRGDELPWRVRQVCGKTYMKLGDLPIGSRDLAWYQDKRIGYLLHDLELLARTGSLPTLPKARALLDWLLSLQETDEGLFRIDEHVEKFVSRSQYHYFPLEDSWRGKHKKYTDVAFRVLLILKILDRTAPL